MALRLLYAKARSMRKAQYILLILLAVLTSCTTTKNKEVNFWDVPIAGDLDSFLNQLDKTNVFSSNPESVDIDYFTKASGWCTFMGNNRYFRVYAHQIANQYGDPDSEVEAIKLMGIGCTMPLEAFDKQYGKHKVEGIGNYWDFKDGEIGMGMLGDTLQIQFIKYQN